MRRLEDVLETGAAARGNVIDIDWTGFLGRTAGEIDQKIVDEFIRGKRVLITGAGGSIGSVLAQRLAGVGVGRLVLLDIAEHGLFELSAALEEKGTSRSYDLIVGDVCDRALLHEVFQEHRPEVVFHAAACKHVALMEENPFAAARSNIVGTHRLLQAACEGGAEQVVLLSTDKAVDPAGIMGATKRVGELLVLASAGPTRVKAVRLPNVLGSSGSAGPLFRRQAARGGPLTITDPACMRYFVLIEDAVRHLVSALGVDASSSVIVPESGGPYSVLDLARFVMGVEEAEIVYTGLRAGEKLVEEMVARDELARSSNVPGLQVAVSGRVVSAALLESGMEEIQRAVEQRDLRRLLEAIVALVPGYEPSGLMLERTT